MGKTSFVYPWEVVRETEAFPVSEKWPISPFSWTWKWSKLVLPMGKTWAKLVLFIGYPEEVVRETEAFLTGHRLTARLLSNRFPADRIPTGKEKIPRTAHWSVNWLVSTVHVWHNIMSERGICTYQMYVTDCKYRWLHAGRFAWLFIFTNLVLSVEWVIVDPGAPAKQSLLRNSTTDPLPDQIRPCSDQR